MAAAPSAGVATATVSLIPYADQVGGHTGIDGKPSALSDNMGKFYKPIQSEQRFLREKAFYEAVFSEDADSSPMLRTLQSFLPRYYGPVEVEGKHHLVLQDVCWGYSKPCILDVKIGFTTSYPWAEQKYIDKSKVKDDSTTQSTLGFRVCGAQVHNPVTGVTFKADRHWGKELTKATVGSAFKTFVSEGCSFTVTELYSVILQQLQDLLAWFREQRLFVFFSSSVLLLYDAAASSLAEAGVKVLLVDFAHTFDAQCDKDDNFIGGLEALMEHLRSVQ